MRCAEIGSVQLRQRLLRSGDHNLLTLEPIPAVDRFAKDPAFSKAVTTIITGDQKSIRSALENIKTQLNQPQSRIVYRLLRRTSL